MQLETTSSTEQRSAFLEAAINRLWERFENRYGSLWMDRWAGLPVDRVKREWAEEISGFGNLAAVLGMAFESVKNNRYPPTLPEFKEACNVAALRKGNYVALPSPTFDKETARLRLQQAAEKAGIQLRRGNKNDL